MASTALAPTPTGKINVGVFDGTRQLFSPDTRVLYFIFDGEHQRKVFDTFPPQKFFELEVQDNFLDDYTVVVSLDGFGTAGFQPVHVTANSIQGVRLLLLPDQRKFDFTGASYKSLQQNKPDIFAVINGTAVDSVNGAPGAQDFYEKQMASNPKNIACLLNILSAMEQIQMGGVNTPLDFLKDLIRDDPNFPMQQDRFYCWTDKKLIDAIIEAGDLFATAPASLHGGSASRSWKEVEFAEANVQFTFHESVAHPQHPDWVVLEPDIDYFKDPLAHILGEVVVNAFGSLTEPVQVYQFRWISGSRPGSIPFDPPYTIVKA